MDSAPFRFETLGDEHDRIAFRCGEEALDRIFHTQVTQDVRRRITNCFVMVEAAAGRIAAYYTLSAASIPLTDLPPDETKRLPRYPTCPRSASAAWRWTNATKREASPELMLMNAVHRTMHDAAAAFTLIVDAKNDRAVAFYQRYGFRSLAGKPRTLFLPLATAQKTLLRKHSH